jgi:hypothetical protein
MRFCAMRSAVHCPRSKPWALAVLLKVSFSKTAAFSREGPSRPILELNL